MGRTRGEPNKIELTATQGLFYRSLPGTALEYEMAVFNMYVVNFPLSSP